MEERYIKLIEAFQKLDIEDKKEEILKNIYDLLKLLYFTNKSIDSDNNILPVFTKSENEDEYYEQLFTYVIFLKEENAKLIEKVIKNTWNKRIYILKLYCSYYVVSCTSYITLGIKVKLLKKGGNEHGFKKGS